MYSSIHSAAHSIFRSTLPQIWPFFVVTQHKIDENSMTDQDWMKYALQLAERAAEEGEVPVGAVMVLENKIIGEGWNQPIASHDPTAHAEIQAIRKSAVHLRNYRLLNTTLYVSLEPCAMCVGAIVHARVGRLVFGADDPKAGGIRSVFQLLDSGHFNHKVDWTGGVLAEPCGQILSQFFQKKRKNQATSKVFVSET